jgi:hypothetical protein
MILASFGTLSPHFTRRTLVLFGLMLPFTSVGAFGCF